VRNIGVVDVALHFNLRGLRARVFTQDRWYATVYGCGPIATK